MKTIGITNALRINANKGQTKPNVRNFVRNKDCANFLLSGVPSAASKRLSDILYSCNMK